jgi:hypothetical protein
MECKLGRKLSKNEFVHHINGDIRDNRPDNLQVITHGDHSRLHHTGRKNSPDTIAKMSKSASLARAINPGPRTPKNPQETSRKHSEYKKKYWEKKKLNHR